MAAGARGGRGRSGREGSVREEKGEGDVPRAPHVGLPMDATTAPSPPRDVAAAPHHKHKDDGRAKGEERGGQEGRGRVPSSGGGGRAREAKRR